MPALTITIRIPPDLAAAIHAEARAQNTKSRTLVRDVLAHVFGTDPDTSANPPPLTRKEWEAGVSAKVAELAAHYGRPRTKTIRAVLRKHLSQRYPALWRDSMDIDACIETLRGNASFHHTQTNLLAEYFDIPACAYK